MSIVTRISIAIHMALLATLLCILCFASLSPETFVTVRWLTTCLFVSFVLNHIIDELRHRRMVRNRVHFADILIGHNHTGRSVGSIIGDAENLAVFAEYGPRSEPVKGADVVAHT